MSAVICIRSQCFDRLGLTLGYIVFQNIVGVSVAAIIGQPTAIGVLNVLLHS